MNFVQRWYNAIRNWRAPESLKALINSLWNMLRKLISASTEIILAQLKDIAIEACMKVREDPSIIIDDTKRKKAFEEIAEQAKIRGIQASDHLINLAIEFAVAWIKKQGN